MPHLLGYKNDIWGGGVILDIAVVQIFVGTERSPSSVQGKMLVGTPLRLLVVADSGVAWCLIQPHEMRGQDRTVVGTPWLLLVTADDKMAWYLTQCYKMKTVGVTQQGKTHFLVLCLVVDAVKLLVWTFELFP